MRKSINACITCIVLLLVGCADYNFSTRISILGAMNDGPGRPKYLDKHQSSVIVSGTPAELQNAYRDALLILGFADIRESDDVIRGDRGFILGFACGVGGETLYLTTEHIEGDHYYVRVVSYKRYPYPASTRFLDGEFRDILVQLLSGTRLSAVRDGVEPI